MARHKKILVVEDEKQLVDMLTMRLNAEKYNVIAAYDGKAGLDRAKKEHPDLIILDVMMPEMDGFEVCRILKEDAKYKHIPIIFLTVKFQPNDIRFGKALGADAYITKPYEPEALLSKIHELIGK